MKTIIKDLKLNCFSYDKVKKVFTPRTECNTMAFLRELVYITDELEKNKVRHTLKNTNTVVLG